jgi:hypothetical protein
LSFRCADGFAAGSLAGYRILEASEAAKRRKALRANLHQEDNKPHEEAKKKASLLKGYEDTTTLARD